MSRSGSILASPEAHALTTLAEASEMARRNGDRNQWPKIPNSVAWLYRELGDVDRAMEEDRAGLEMARRHGVLEAEINSSINLGLNHSHAGDAGRAVAAFHEVELMLARDEWLRWRFDLRRQEGLARHWLAQGDLSRAQQHGSALLEAATHYQVHKYVALARTLLAEIAMARGDLDSSGTEIAAAIEELEHYPAPLVAWKAHATHARLYSRIGNSMAAEQAYSAAAMVARQIAEQVKDDDLRQQFENLVSRSLGVTIR